MPPEGYDPLRVPFATEPDFTVDDFPEIRKHMRAMAVAKAPEPVVLTPLEEIAKQLRIANLIAYAQFMPRSGRQHDALVEIEEGLGT